jgi:hypothetical protein
MVKADGLNPMADPTDEALVARWRAIACRATSVRISKTCARCARALALSTALHRPLARQPDPVPPPPLAAAILAAVRRECWQSEQYLDLVFNICVALAVLAGLVGLWAVLSASGMAAVSADLVRLFAASAGTVLTRATPELPLYAAAIALVVTGLTVWWWVERGLEI